MNKFHINPETGEPGNCTASSGNCPFGGDEIHFTSKEAARAAYEMIASFEKTKALGAWKRKARPVQNTLPDTYVGHGVPMGHGTPIQRPTPPPSAPRPVTPNYGHGSSGHGR